MHEEDREGATGLAGVRSFAEVGDLLGGCDPTSLDPAERDHRRHLAGLALLELEDAEGTRAVWLEWRVRGDGAGPGDPRRLEDRLELESSGAHGIGRVEVFAGGQLAGVAAW